MLAVRDEGCLNFRAITGCTQVTLLTMWHLNAACACFFIKDFWVCFRPNYDPPSRKSDVAALDLSSRVSARKGNWAALEILRSLNC